MKKFFKIIFLTIGIIAGFSSCQKRPLNDPYEYQKTYQHAVLQEQFVFHVGNYDVGQALCWLPGLWDLGVNTRDAGNWNMRCAMKLVITSNAKGYVNGVLSNLSTGTITYYVERPGLLTSMDTKEHFYSVLTSGIQTVNFTAYNRGDGTWIQFAGGIKFFTNSGVVDFSAFTGLYSSNNPTVTKNGINYYVLHFSKQMSGQGTIWDQPLDIEFDYR